MLTTADGFEYELGAPAWDHLRGEWRVNATIHDGDKRFTLAVVVDKAVKPTAVSACADKSMAQHKHRDLDRPTKGSTLKGGV